MDRPSLSATDGVGWAAVLGPPLVWFASQQASYALVPWACHGGPLIAIHLVNLAALLLVALAGAAAWRHWRRAGPDVSDEFVPPPGRARFLALVGFLLSGLFGLAIIAQAIGAFFLGPCAR